MTEPIAVTDELRDIIARYLDGACSADERATIERALLDDGVARAFAEEVLFRDLVRRAPPDVPPDEVLARWEAAVVGALDAEAAEDAPPWFTQALDAIGWSVLGPAMSVTTRGADLARMGLSSVRYGLPRGRVAPRRPWWRRVLRWRRS